MWQRVKRILDSPIRVLTFAILGFFAVTSAVLLVVGALNLSGQDTTNGAIGVVLFAFLIRAAVRAFESLDAEGLATRETGRSPARPPARRLLIPSPVNFWTVLRVLIRLLVLSLIGFFLAVSVSGLVLGLADRKPGALIWVVGVALFIVLFVTAIGAFRLQDERDGPDY
jgi:quinol-cytochrome oxidoreductase complex cytochrome b subunit